MLGFGEVMYSPSRRYTFVFNMEGAIVRRVIPSDNSCLFNAVGCPFVFYYITCSNCKKASNAYGDTECWCNHCQGKVTAIPKLKFDITITDPSATIQATIFQEAAAQFYGITPTVLMENLDEHRLSFPPLQKLAEPKECTITLKVAMYSYGNNTQHRVTVQAISAENTDEDPQQPNKRALICSDTSSKRSKTQHDEEASASAPSEPNVPANISPLITSAENQSSLETTKSNEE